MSRSTIKQDAGDKHVIHAGKAMAPDVVASKLVNDPLYGTLVSDDHAQTSNAVTYLYLFIAAPFVFILMDIHRKFGVIGLFLALTFMLFCIAHSTWKSFFTFIAGCGFYVAWLVYFPGVS